MEVILLTLNRRFYQHLEPWSTMCLDSIVQSFGRIEIRVKVLDILIDYEKVIVLKGEKILCTSSQNPGFKSYLDDIYYFLQINNKLFPRYDLIKAHENKGYQELLKRNLSIEGLLASYHCSLIGANIEGTKVIKTIFGSSSQGVSIVSTQNDLYNWYSRRRYRSVRISEFGREIKELLKRYVLRWRFSSDQYFYYRTAQSFVLQEFIPDLTRDFKILNFSEKYYILERNIKPKDFRASGSGLFRWVDDVNEQLLNYAEYISKKISTPVLGLDIAESGVNYELIEFQAIHLGPLTLLNSPGYFIKDNLDKWNFIAAKSVLEDEYVLAYSSVLHN